MRDVQSMTDAGGHSRASEGHAGGIAVVNDANLSVVSKHADRTRPPRRIVIVAGCRMC